MERRRGARSALSIMLATSALAAASAAWADGLDRSVLPIAAPPFTGRIAETAEQSTPAVPFRVAAPAGAPNFLLVMADDVGFAASSAFGGPVRTPNFDRLAAHGLRYNAFHTTAICSSTRAALLTGRNHHAVGAGHLVDTAAGYPGYDGSIPLSAATIARILKGNGYNTAFFGKHHNVPTAESSAAGPFDQWPTGLGFDYFYGFIGGDVDQWNPRLFRGITQLEDGGAGEGELLDKRLADDALTWLHNQNAAAPDKPFFIYLAPGSTHAPHQAPADWIARFKGKFDQGWDQAREETLARQKAAGLVPRDAELTPRPAQIPAWSSLTPTMQRVDARKMEVYAAQLAYEDAQVGRLVDELARMGQLDNTLVVLIVGDNGASAEAGPEPTDNEIGRMTNRVKETEAYFDGARDNSGGPKTYENYPAGWALAMDTPFQWYKQIASHLGGMRNGMIVSWPKAVAAQGQVRTRFAHVTDILPTLLDAAKIPAPAKVDGVEQQRLDGVSLVPTFSDPRADNHHTQYFEIAGNRAIYHDGWMASTTPQRMPWDERPLPPGVSHAPVWELYDLTRDFSQAKNLAASQPAKLKALTALWDAEARRNNVYPIEDRPNTLRSGPAQAARPNIGRTHFTYWGKDVSVAQAAAPMLVARSFSVTAKIDMPSADATGVLMATGSWFGGWSFYVRNGRPIALEAASQVPGDQFRVAAAEPIAPGPATVTYRFTSDGGVFAGGDMAILVNGKTVAEGRIPRTIAITAGLGETLDIGRDTGAPVGDDYGRGEFPGAIERVDVELGPFTAPAGPIAAAAKVPD
jgi:arylsulfatase A-like enzyme